MRASALASAKNSVSITTHRLDHLLMTVSKPPREMASSSTSALWRAVSHMVYCHGEDSITICQVEFRDYGQWLFLERCIGLNDQKWGAV